MAPLVLIVELAIKADRLDDFKVASAALRAATNEEPGTRRYDWYLSEDGRECVTVEEFDDSAAFLAHHHHVADLVPAVSETAVMARFDVIGDVTDQVREELSGTATGYFAFLGGISR